MSDKSSSTSSGGIGVLGLLGVVFVVLKILGIQPIAAWSWWWVTAPFWGGAVLFLGIAAIILLFMIIFGGRSYR